MSSQKWQKIVSLQNDLNNHILAATTPTMFPSLPYIVHQVPSICQKYGTNGGLVLLKKHTLRSHLDILTEYATFLKNTCAKKCVKMIATPSCLLKKHSTLSTHACNAAEHFQVLLSTELSKIHFAKKGKNGTKMI